MADGQLQPLINRLMHTVGFDGGQLSDAQLLERFVLAQDEAAFESLLWRHGPMVLALCQRLLRHRHDAEDVFQAVFLVFFRKAHSIRHSDCVASWLYKVAYRLAVKARAQSADRASDNSVESLPAPQQPDAFLTDDLRPVLDDALSRLPEKYRVPLVLHYLQGKTVEQVAAEVGCPPGTVSGRLHRARELLRRRLARRGVVLSGAIGPVVLARAGEPVAVSAMLACTTLGAVRGLAGKVVAAGAVSATALALAESSLRVLPVGRWKIATLLLLILGLAGLGAGLAGWRLLAPQETGSPLPPAAPRVAQRPVEARRPAVARVEDPLPRGARARLGSQRFTFGGFIHALALSPDGATVAGAGHGPAVILWEAATGKMQRIVATSEDGSAAIHTVAFSPDGTAVAAGDSRGHFHRFKTATGQRFSSGQIHEGTVEAVRFAPDGQTLASAGADGVIRLWKLDTGEVLHTLAGHRGSVYTVAFTPDGKTLASGGEDGTVRLWEAAIGKPCRTCQGHGGAVRAVAFSSDGKVLASAGADRRVLLWRPATGQVFLQCDLRPVVPLALAFVDDRRLVVGGECGLVRFYDVVANKMLHDYRGLVWAVSALACSRDGRKLVAAGQDGVFLRWDIASGKADEPGTPGHRGPVMCVAMSPDGKVIASGGMDGTVRLWNSVSGRALETYRPDWQAPLARSYVDSVAFVAGGRAVAATGHDGAIHLHDRQTGARVRWSAHRGKVNGLVSCPGGRCLVSAGEDGAVCLWRVATREKVCTYAADGVVKHLAVSRDGKRLAGVTRDGTIHLWELATGKSLGTVAGKGSGLDRVAFSPDSAVLAASGGTGGVRLWRLAAGAPVPLDSGQSEDRVVALAFAPDGALALAGRDGVIRVRGPNGAEEVGRFVGHQTRINAVVFAPDGKSLLSASDDGTVLIWDVPRRRGR
jgi:RNA polymerase sigma factor (sigma-70 family)